LLRKPCFGGAFGVVGVGGVGRVWGGSTRREYQTGHAPREARASGRPGEEG